jgi:hypothetical protein
MADDREAGGSEREARARTPFDNPVFLPVLLWLFALWFGYDAFLNKDEHMQVPTTLWFNRIGFPILVVLALRYTWQGVREKRAEAPSPRPREGGEPGGAPPG